MDEPFAALDEITRDRMAFELMRLWHHYRKTVLFVTHSLNEAVYLADRVIVLSARPGRIVDDVAVDLPRPRSFALTSSGLCNSDSEVNPRRSANNTPISIVIPPGGASSTQTAQMFGFLRDGR